ncbi:MAG: T9SS type A sorting domain-containing protein, partial [Flavobacteriaceae bacterium]|nr:T9SS type A sorting domain-containing protein [Flavobacteriaceae bacterium]
PFSEPESSAVRDFMAQVLPKTAFSTHSTAGSYLMPYGYNTSPPAFEIYSEWASVFLSENDYPYGVTFQMLGYTSCGTTRDFMHSEGIYGWTPEIDGSGFWPPQSTIFDLVGENVFPLFYQSWIAGAFVDVQSHELGGNAIPGETMELTVEVKNVGVGATAENVIVEVTPSHPGITVSAPQSYGSVAPRSRADNLGTSFEITLDPNFTESSFELTLVTTQDGIFNDQMVLTVQTGEKEVLYFDNAENGASNWISSGTGILWSVVLDDAYSGTQCFGDSNGGNGENNTQNSFELLPTFDFSGAQQPAISFVSKYSFENGDRVDFQMSLDAGISWQTLDSFEGAESWHEKNYLLQNLQGEASVNFRFTLFNDSFIPADGFYFDDFEVANYTNGILGNSDFEFNVVGVSPNPFSGQIVVKWFDTVDFALIKVGLFDLQGRAIDMKLGYGPKEITINGLENLSSGLYFLRIEDPVKGQFVQKMIKQ